MLTERHAGDQRPAKGLPQLGEMPVGFRLPADQDTRETPYRLPRLPATPDYEDVGGIYSRYGYTHTNPYENLGEKGESQLNQWKYPLPTRAFRIYAGPSFRQAVVAPSSTPRLVLPGARVPQVNRLLGRSHTLMSMASSQNQNNTRPTPVLRSAAKEPGSLLAREDTFPDHDIQMTRQQLRQQQLLARQQYEASQQTGGVGDLQWVLNPQRHFQIDKKGQQRNQGPFSREFTVHAMAPPNWLRMKWGRRYHQMDGYRPVAVPVPYRQYTSLSGPMHP
ncbi:hypothetical protein BOX15_Mlig010404g1 [Macrostomum lignano]|uniref:Uncharacterized protein n=1 Tax=Macrostomum lignano TaxID=282301 RepID=A0A267H4D0_9PLAT|nr:hypothetical protein BOX15_Mlig010404g1 [Macrostomum lignano]